MKQFLKKLRAALTERCYSFLHLALAITICMVFAFLMFCLGRWTPPEDMTPALSNTTAGGMLRYSVRRALTEL